MRVLAVLALAGGCYDPHANRGAPCDVTAPRCPAGQACIDGVCGGPDPGEVDAATRDGVMAKDDPDGDGIESALDNCALVANADQHDEDTDAIGDACDPCPIESNPTPTDPDGDGVADGCDPHPMAAGDKLVVFESFRAPPPATWQLIGNTVVANDEVALTTVANNHSAVVPPVGPLGNATLTASVIVDAQVGTADSAASLAMPYDPANDEGVFCELYAPMAQSNAGRYVSLWDSPATQERGKNNFAWTTGVAYRVTFTRAGSSYTCTVAQGGTSHTATGSTPSAPAPAKAAIATYGANARAQWMMIVTSP